MTGVLDLRPSLELTVFAVMLMAIVWLTLIVFHLHARVSRLEQSRAENTTIQPAYRHLVGRSLHEAVPQGTEVLLILSARCRACERLLTELGAGNWRRRAAILWKDGVAATSARIPDSVTVIPDSGHLNAELGVSVTPFALELASSGTVTSAGPIGSLADLGWEPAFRAATR